MCYHGYELPRPPTMAAKFVQESASVHGHCDCIVHLWVGLSRRFPVLAISVSQLYCVRSCLLLDSETSAELGEAEISDDAKSF